MLRRTACKIGSERDSSTISVHEEGASKSTGCRIGAEREGMEFEVKPSDVQAGFLGLGLKTKKQQKSVARLAPE